MLQAAIAELLGDERPSIEEALRSCPRGEVRPARCEGVDVAVGRLTSGRAVVLADRCPHDGGTLSDGWLDGDTIVCARHGWEFDTRSGRCSSAPRLCAEVLSAPDDGDGATLAPSAAVVAI